MELPKLGIRNTYLLKPKWPERNTGNAHLKGECPQKDILMLEDHEGVRKKYENSTSRKKMIKNDLIASPALRERKILGEKLRIIKKFPKNS
jgi:hypothetical protein